MSRPPEVFDLGALADAINVEKSARNVTWQVVTAETGVSTSTIRRMASAEDAEADGVLTLVAWLGLQPEAFMDGVSSDAAVAPLGSMVVRVDMASVRRTSPSISWKGSRTTIQRLAAAARAAGVTVESLSRRSAT